MAVANPIEMARQQRAMNAHTTVARLEAELDEARKARAKQFAAWHDAGASYGTIAGVAELSRTTVIDLVKWGRKLDADTDASHPRGARTEETA
jgi:hypothetical protein